MNNNNYKTDNSLTRRSEGVEESRNSHRLRSNASSSSSPRGILTHTGRIRRSPHVRPRPEVAVTAQTLAMPGLTNTRSKESRNDQEPAVPLRSSSIFSTTKTEEKVQEARQRAFDAKRALQQAKDTASSIRNGESDDENNNNSNAIHDQSHQFPKQKDEQQASTTNYSSTPQTEEPLTIDTGLNSPIGIAHDTLEEFASPFSMQSMGSMDDYDKAVENLPSRYRHMDDSGKPLAQEQMLSRLDGTDPSSILTTTRHDSSTVDANLSLSSSDQPFEVGGDPLQTTQIPTTEVADIVQVPIKPVVIRSMEVAEQQPDEINAIGSWLNYFMGSMSKDDSESHHDISYPSHTNGGSCGGSSSEAPSTKTIPVANTMSDATGHLSYPEAFRASHKADSVLSDWVNNKFMPRDELPLDGTYSLGESKTIIVHEILRGNWTWCTAWSPDGNMLAIATENHHLAVVDTTKSTVWRVKHDKRVHAPLKDSTTQSIRSIAWGDQFIAIGGIGNAVSILAPTEPYQVLHTITPTGFVGSIDWLPNSNKLLLGSREGKATIHELWEHQNAGSSENFLFSNPAVREIRSKTIHTIDRGSAWVNAVQFNPKNTIFALGDGHGVLAVYSFEDAVMMELTNVANFKLEDAILDIEWSADGNYLYAGGEDYAITVINTEYWEPVHKIKRDRWVQFISTSLSSTHLAVGGVTSEVSILDVNNGWENIINISTKGLVPLSANWHPDDQYLVLTGQDNSILAIETTNARHVPGHFLRSSYPIVSIAFSPDGRMAAIGNEMGVVSIFVLSETTFESVYEMVVDCSGSLAVEWSPNGSFCAIAAGNKLVVLSRKESLANSAPPNTTGFYVAKVVRDLGGTVHDVSIDPTSRFLAVSGKRTRVLHAASDFKIVLEMENGGTTLANSWSHDGKWFAAIGKDHNLVIYDTCNLDLTKWESVFSVTTEGAGRALAWGRSTIGGLQYCAYGGQDKKIHIMEIRTKERTWETVLALKRDGEINDLDWNADGLVAAAISNGTVAVLDLSYLQSGWAVNEMDYNWQRQALTCFTEIRRNRGKHSMNSVKWIPSEEDSDNFLAIGGTDGELEIIDLAERQNCKGFQKKNASD